MMQAILPEFAVYPQHLHALKGIRLYAALLCARHELENADEWYNVSVKIDERQTAIPCTDLVVGERGTPPYIERYIIAVLLDTARASHWDHVEAFDTRRGQPADTRMREKPVMERTIRHSVRG
jgi:hypothetical protein